MENTEEIWYEFHKKLLAFIESRIKDKSYAEDILQDVFLKIHSNIDNLKNLKKIESWIYQITRNTIIDFYRSSRNHEELPQWLASHETDETEKFHHQLSSCLKSLVGQLPARYGIAVMTSDIEGRPQKELAHMENISLSGAKSRIQRGRILLKKLFHDCCGNELSNSDQIPECSSVENGCTSCSGN